MGRRINAKCQHCATLTVEEAIALHGPNGDNCWNPGNVNGWGYDCHRRRSHYRHRDDINRTRRRLRRSGKVEADPLPTVEGYLELLPAPPSTAFAAVLVLYRNHKDAPVHAVGAEIWQGDRKVMDIKPVHCMGMRGNEVTAYIQDVLSQLHQQFRVSRFEDVVKELPVSQCPIVPCPLKANP